METQRTVEDTAQQMRALRPEPGGRCLCVVITWARISLMCPLLLFSFPVRGFYLGVEGTPEPEFPGLLGR